MTNRIIIMSLISVCMIVKPLTDIACPPTQDTAGNRPVSVTGTVLAYDAASGLAALTAVPTAETLIVRVDRKVGAKNIPQFLQVRYEHFFKGPGLPEILTVEKRTWVFTLIREEMCDGPIEMEFPEFIKAKSVTVRAPIIKRVPGAENDYIPKKVTLDCYKFSLDGFRLLRKE